MTHSWRRGDSCHCRHYTLFCFCFFPLSSSSLTLCCSAGLPPFLLPPPSPQGPDFVEPKLQNCTSWSWRSLPFLFVGLPVLPLWSSWTLGETSWCTDSWGDNSLFFASVRVFFFGSPEGFSAHLHCFSICSAALQVDLVIYRLQKRPTHKRNLQRKLARWHPTWQRNLVCTCSSGENILAPGGSSHED